MIYLLSTCLHLAMLSVLIIHLESASESNSDSESDSGSDSGESSSPPVTPPPQRKKEAKKARSPQKNPKKEVSLLDLDDCESFHVINILHDALPIYVCVCVFVY